MISYTKLRQNTKEEDIQSILRRFNLVLDMDVPENFTSHKKKLVNTELRRYGMKMCWSCETIKDLFDFTFNHSTNDMLNNNCDDCMYVQGRERGLETGAISGEGDTKPRKRILKELVDMPKKVERGFEVDHQQYEDILSIKVKYNRGASMYDDEQIDKILHRQAKFVELSLKLLELRKQLSNTMDFSTMTDIINVIGELQVLILSVNDDIKEDTEEENTE